MTRTEKDKERGKGFLKCQGLLPADSFPVTCQGLFFVVVELGFLTGKLGIQCALGAPPFLGGPKVRLEASWRLGVSPDVSYFRRKVLSWCQPLMREVKFGASKGSLAPATISPCLLRQKSNFCHSPALKPTLGLCYPWTKSELLHVECNNLKKLVPTSLSSLLS